MIKIDDVMKLVNAGFTADQIMRFAEPTPEPAPEPQAPVALPATPDINSSATAPPEQDSPTEPEPEKPQEDAQPAPATPMIPPEIQKEIDDQKKQIERLQQIISSTNFGGNARTEETDPQAYLDKILNDY